MYGAVVAARAARAGRRGPERVGIPVVSVGNLAVGGTGKTPLTAWVADALAGVGREPAIVTRGFADEVALHREWCPGRRVFARPDRVAAARDARDEGADVVVADDAFQHRRLHRDVDIVLLACEDPFPGRLLPAGPYREPPSALARADVVVVTRRATAARGAVDPGGDDVGARLATAVAAWTPEALGARVVLEAGGWTDLAGAVSPPPQGDALVVTAIARPDALRTAVGSLLPGRADLLAFADHHRYDRRDLDRIGKAAGGRAVVVTEKDAVKLRTLGDLPFSVHVLGQRVVWEAGETSLRALLASLPRPGA